eukprot:9467750-Pyramimonas_sp.AAC.1
MSQQARLRAADIPCASLVPLFGATGAAPAARAAAIPFWHTPHTARAPMGAPPMTTFIDAVPAAA